MNFFLVVEMDLKSGFSLLVWCQQAEQADRQRKALPIPLSRGSRTITSGSRPRWQKLATRLMMDARL